MIASRRRVGWLFGVMVGGSPTAQPPTAVDALYTQWVEAASQQGQLTRRYSNQSSRSQGLPPEAAVPSSSLLVSDRCFETP